jgi:6-phosphogluconolactonase
MKKITLIMYAMFSLIMFSSSCKKEVVRLFVSTYAEPGQKGLFVFDLNCKEGTFNLLSSTDAGPNPTYYCISHKNALIYAGNEVKNFNGIESGGVTTLKYDAKTGGVEKVNEIAVPTGGPGFISLSHNEDFLLMTSYSGGYVAVVKLDEKGIPVRVTDTIFYHGEEGTRSHAHMIIPNPAGTKIYFGDLGLDQIIIYNLDPVSGKLQQMDNGIATLPKGTGPRHFVFNSTSTKMYVIDELNSTVSVFNVDETGRLQPIQTLTTLSEGYEGKNACADIHLGKNDEYLYGSNRGENTIVTYKVGTDGKLTLAGHTSCGGTWPRNFVIDPSGEYIVVGNERSGEILLFSIDKKTGLPVSTGKDYKMTRPSCLKF